MFDICNEKPYNLTKTEQHIEGTPQRGIRSTLPPRFCSHPTKPGGLQSSSRAVVLNMGHYYVRENYPGNPRVIVRNHIGLHNP